MRSFFILFLILVSVQCAFSDALKSPHIRVQLVSNYSEVNSKTPLKVGFLAQLEEGWHLYWKFAGDSGRAPELIWRSTEEGVSISSIEWPTPEKIKVGPLTNIGLVGEVLLAQNIRLPSTFNDFSLTLSATWLVCKEECIPGKATLTLPIRYAAKEVPSPYFKTFQNAELLLPHSGKHWSINQERKGGDVVFTITSSEAPLPRGSLIFLPDSAKQIDLSAEQQMQNAGDSIFLRALVAQTAEKDRKEFSGVLLSSEPDFDGKNSLHIFQKQDEYTLIEKSKPTLSYSLISVLVLAFIGGLLLNLMPCVFPILSIKILSLLKGTDEEHKQFGVFFTVGVLVSFFLLGLLFLSLKAAGASIGWGFQFQYPEFVICISILLTLVALNLLGFFEIGRFLQTKAGSVTCSNTSKGAFLSGVLATIVATPCTAPFMGIAIAATVTRPFTDGMIIFLSMGIGMSFPYLLFAFFPALTKVLPKPGAWMESFKQLLAFPVLLTVVWLLDVFGKQTSSTSVTLLVFTLVVISLAAWIFGRATHPQNSTLKRRFLLMISFIIGGGVLFYIFTTPLYAVSSQKAENIDSWGQVWRAYSRETLEKSILEKKIIFLDFTAAWCITCQVNKRVVFSHSALREFIKQHEVILIRGDWTLMDPEITEALEMYQREGVPLNVVMLPDKSPQVLPSILTPALVMSALKGESF